MTELGDSLGRVGFIQLLLLFGFVACYMLAIGGLFGTGVRLRAAGLALLQAVAFTALTDPWVHGALLVAFVVAGLGLFVLLSWLLAWLFGPRPALPPYAQADPVAETSADTSTPPPSQSMAEGRPAAPKLGRRLRATR
jgi:uncharacterized membrane protein YedE/YeeE